MREENGTADTITIIAVTQFLLSKSKKGSICILFFTLFTSPLIILCSQFASTSMESELRKSLSTQNSAKVLAVVLQKDRIEGKDSYGFLEHRIRHTYRTAGI